MTRDELEAAMRQTAQQTPRKITVEGWGDILVRRRTVGEIEDEEDRLIAAGYRLGPDAPAGSEPEHKDPFSGIARRFAGVLCDEHGALIYDPASEADLRRLNDLFRQQPDTVIARLNVAFQEESPGN